MPVFLLEVRQVFDDWPERHFRERAWCTPLQAAALVDDPDLASSDPAAFDSQGRLIRRRVPSAARHRRTGDRI
jgi:hypothetical protein